MSRLRIKKTVWMDLQENRLYLWNSMWKYPVALYSIANVVKTHHARDPNSKSLE